MIDIYFFKVTATTENNTYRHILSQHNALPITRLYSGSSLKHAGLERGGKTSFRRMARPRIAESAALRLSRRFGAPLYRWMGRSRPAAGGGMPRRACPSA